MALTKCPECSHEVSDKAINCPKCGYPLQPAASQPPSHLDALIKQTLSQDGKIAAIKLYRERHGNVGLAEAKQYVERLEAGLPPGAVSTRGKAGCSPIVVFGGLFLLAAIGLGIYLYSSYRQPAMADNPSLQRQTIVTLFAHQLSPHSPLVRLAYRRAFVTGPSPSAAPAKLRLESALVRAVTL